MQVIFGEKTLKKILWRAIFQKMVKTFFGAIFREKQGKKILSGQFFKVQKNENFLKQFLRKKKFENSHRATFWEKTIKTSFFWTIFREETEKKNSFGQFLKQDASEVPKWYFQIIGKNGDLYNFMHLSANSRNSKSLNKLKSSLYSQTSEFFYNQIFNFSIFGAFSEIFIGYSKSIQFGITTREALS